MDRWVRSLTRTVPGFAASEAAGDDQGTSCYAGQGRECLPYDLPGMHADAYRCPAVLDDLKSGRKRQACIVLVEQGESEDGSD